MIERTPALAALVADIASVPLAAKPDKPEPSPKDLRNRAFAAKTAAEGGSITNVVLTPAAKSLLDAARLVPGFVSQGRYVSAAVEAYGAPAALDAGALAAVAKMRADWPIDSDAEAVSLAVRWFVRFVEEENIESLDLGNTTQGA